ncbi:hypothetical protein BGX31_010093 [Mortierella sp. GBA43]|nr:hypothetical protein BGX31_010093 [Mortierella sp. GBA43]
MATNSPGKLLVYNVPDLITTLGLTRDKLTVLGIVSRNDYDSNIASLSPATNFKLVKNASGGVPSIPASTKTQILIQNAHKKDQASSPRGWMKEQKDKDTGEGSDSITAIKSSLPPIRGENPELSNYLTELGNVEDQLDCFYNGNNNYKSNKWDLERSKEYEYQKMTDQLLGMVGGSIGRKRDGNDKVVIAIGLGKFSCHSRLTSLHGSFLAYFVQKVRSLNYIVVGVNEYYTSKKCPVCEEFVGQVKIRRLYCARCQTHMHRDTMAGHNICNVVRGQLMNQTRLLYLQPIDKDGNYLDGKEYGRIIAQACHASTAVLHKTRDMTDTREYLADINSMHKVVLEVKNLPQLEELSSKLSELDVPHVTWREQPEDILTCLSTSPIRRDPKVKEAFKKCSLFR